MSSNKIPPAWLKAAGCWALLSLPVLLKVSADTPVIVVTPARYAQPIEQVGSSVVRLEGEELRQRGIQFVEDALREVPSLIVSSQGARGSQVQLRARGNEANHVLVLIDGIRVGNASSGEFDLSGLGLSAVDNIEVLLGPQSTLYGSDAIGGVVNITTIKGEVGYSGRIGLERGERGIQSLQASVRGASQRWHYALSLDDFEDQGISSAAEANGNVEQDPYAKQSVYFRSGYQSEYYAASLLGGSSRADLDFDGTDTLTGLATDEALNQQHSEQDHLSLLIEIPTHEQRMQNQLQISRIDNDLDSISADFGEFATATERVTAEYRGSIRINQGNSLQFGLQHIDEKLTTESISSFFTSVFAADYEQSGLYLNWLHQYQQLNLSLGARVGDHDGFGRHDDYRLTASYQHSPVIRYRAAWGTAYKVPSLQELYGGFGGNPELEPEQSESAEIGIEYQQDSYQLTATYFDQQTTNLIRFQPITKFSGINKNVGKAESQLRMGLGNLFAVAEQYPELKANESFQHLQARISTLEESIADRRLQDDARFVHRALGDRGARSVMVSWGYRSFAGTGGLG